MADVILGAWIGAGSTVFAALVGIGAIVFQLGRQGKLNRASIAEAERRRLKSRMYEEVEAACSAVTDAQSSLTSKLILAVQGVQLAAYCHKNEVPFSPPDARIMDLSRLNGEFQTSLIHLITLIERRQFVSPDILIFRMALSAAGHGAREKFSKQFFRKGMPMFPADRPDGQGIFPYNPPTPEDADELHSIAMAIVDDLSNVAAYVEDFSVEMQNLLVADLFGSRVEHRRPIDPSYRVITLRDAAPLERYFLEETEWGRWVTEEEARAVERLEGKGGRS